MGAFSGHPGGGAPHPSGNRRVRGRVRVHDHTCSLGEILDVSATGMRIRLTSGVAVRQGDTIFTSVACSFGSVRMTVKVAWVRRAGFFSKQIGVQILDPTPEAARALADLARSALDNYAPTIDNH